MSSWDRAIKFVLAQEGGYVFDRNDPGGETKYGISKRRFPNLKIRELTVETAMQIYYDEFWLKMRGPRLPPLLALATLDWFVNSGPPGLHALQKELGGLKVDGFIGPRTLARAQAVCDSAAADAEMALGLNQRRIAFLGKLIRRQPERNLRYLVGWMRRVHRLTVAIMEGRSALQSSEATEAESEKAPCVCNP